MRWRGEEIGVIQSRGELVFSSFEIFKINIGLSEERKEKKRGMEKRMKNKGVCEVD